MAEQKIELRKIRDFSENIIDTFLFIRQQFKPLIYSFLAIAGIFMLATAIFGGLYQSQFGNVFKEMLSGSRKQMDVMQMYGANYFIFLLLSILNIAAMQVAVVAYMKLYAANGETPTIEAVWNVFKQYFLKAALFTFPVYLLILVGMVFCLAPGIYWAVVLMPFQIILVMEDESFGGAFSRCFTIIKENFWASFGVYIVVYIIYAVAATVISGVVGLISGLLSYFTTKDIVSTIGIATSFLSIFSYLFYVIFFVSIVLQYFSLVEKRDSTGMIQRLDKLGESNQDFGNIKEDY